MLLRDRFDPRYFDADVLFRYHAGWAGLSFSRASTATYIDRDGILREVGPDVPRIDWSHGQPALRLEPQRTNLMPEPATLAGHTITTSGTGVVDLGSGIADGVATVHFERVSTDGGDRRYIMPTFEIATTIPHVFSIDWRHIAGEPRIDWLLRGTAVDAHPQGQVAIASRQATGEWTAGVGCTILGRIRLADGFERLYVRVAPSVWNGSGNQVSSQMTHRYAALGIWHYAYRRPQVEAGPAGTSFTDGTRAREMARVPWPYPTTMPWTVCVRAILPGGNAGWSDGVTNYNPTIFNVGGSPFSANGIGVHAQQTGVLLQMRAAANGATTALPDVPFAPEPGAEVLILAHYAPQPDGTATGSVAVSIAGGAWVTRSGSLGPVPQQLSMQQFGIGGYGAASNNDGLLDVRDVLALRGASWTMDDVRRLLPW